MPAHVLRFALLTAVVTGCAGTQPAVVRAVDAAELTVDQAHQIIAAYEQRRAIRVQANADDPLRDPKSLDDVLEVLRRDQISLFPEAVKFATTQSGPQPLALRAQIELAWGEAQLILAELLQRASGDLRAQAGRLEVKKHADALGPADAKRLTELRVTLAELRDIEQALTRAGGGHINQGATLARLVIDQAPNDYHGYRVAADYYRLRDDWAGFDEMVKKIEAANPDSNGLVFLRGMEALHRHNDPARAEQHFKQALERDPKFARAQVQLLLAQRDTTGAFAALQKLKEINPHHQIVAWAGPAIEEAHAAYRAREQREDQRIEDQALSVPQR